MKLIFGWSTGAPRAVNARIHVFKQDGESLCGTSKYGFSANIEDFQKNACTHCNRHLDRLQEQANKRGG